MPPAELPHINSDAVIQGMFRRRELKGAVPITSTLAAAVGEALHGIKYSVDHYTGDSNWGWSPTTPSMTPNEIAESIARGAADVDIGTPVRLEVHYRPSETANLTLVAEDDRGSGIGYGLVALPTIRGAFRAIGRMPMHRL